MTQHIKAAHRDVGSAAQRFLPPEPDQERKAIYKAQVARANGYKKLARLTGSRWQRERGEKLERMAFRYYACRYEYIVLRCGGCGRHFIGPLRCESRICEFCGRKRYAQALERLMPFLNKLKRTKTHRLMFLTLTLRRVPDYAPTRAEAVALFSDTRQLINGLYPKSKGCGAVGVLEVGSGFNLHIHLLVYGHFVSQAQISQLWLQVTGTSQVVDIRAVRSPKKSTRYLLKYLGKPSALTDPIQIAQYLDMITGLRRIHTYGIFYNEKLFSPKGCPCPLCGGDLSFSATDGGLAVPSDALFFSEAFEIAKAA